MLPLLAMVVAPVATANVSRKVAYPVFVGFSASTLSCVLNHYGVHIDTPSAIGVVVFLMGLVGYSSPNGPQHPTGDVTSTPAITGELDHSH